MTDPSNTRMDLTSAESPHFASDQQPEVFQAWEEIESGRYLPRRVRGSCQGRALG
jgi:hypothetical protein